MKAPHKIALSVFLVVASTAGFALMAAAQTAPSAGEVASYTGLHQAAHRGDLAALAEFIADGANLEDRDRSGRTPAHVAAFASHGQVLRVLAEAGADLNALEHRAYDVVTIAAVANDIEILDLALSLGANAGNITSPYDGTALIAAAHLGHYDVVERLIAAGAPLDHINNLGWTALIEAVVLGDGSADYAEIVRALAEAGADKRIGDRQSVTPLEHARASGYADIVAILE